MGSVPENLKSKIRSVIFAQVRYGKATEFFREPQLEMVQEAQWRPVNDLPSRSRQCTCGDKGAGGSCLSSDVHRGEQQTNGGYSLHLPFRIMAGQVRHMIAF